MSRVEELTIEKVLESIPPPARVGGGSETIVAYSGVAEWVLKGRTERVLALHRERDGDCEHCSSFDSEGLSSEPWPCLTVRILNGGEK